MDTNHPTNVKPDDNDSEYEEEELYIYADFQNKLPFEALKDPNLKIKIIGIDTTEPIFQINSKMFEGTFDYSMGTQLFFQENTNENSPTSDTHLYETVPNQPYEFISKTNKILKMNRIFVEAKDESTTDTISKDSGGGGIDKDVAIIFKTENSEPPILLTKSYSEALDQLLKPGEAPPRSLDEEDEVFFRKYAQIDKLNPIDGNIQQVVDGNDDIDPSGEGASADDAADAADADESVIPSISSLNVSKEN